MQRERLRDQLAEHHGQEGDDGDHRDERGVVGVEAEAETREHRGEIGREGAAAVGGGRRSDRGDADLHRREQPLRLVLQRERSARAPAALARELAQSRATHRDQRDFGPGEDPVQQDQADNDGEFVEHPGKAWR